MPKLALISLLGALVLGVVLSSSASDARAMWRRPTLTEMIRESAAIFLGTVSDVDIAAGTGSSPRTRVRVRVDEVWANGLVAERNESNNYAFVPTKLNVCP